MANSKAPIREDVVEALVKWKLEGKGPEDDPDRTHYRLINKATWPEMMEALKRVEKRRLH